MLKRNISIALLVLLIIIIGVFKLSVDQIIDVILIGFGLRMVIEAILIKLEKLDRDNAHETNLLGDTIAGLGGILWGLTLLIREITKVNVWLIFEMVGPLLFVSGFIITWRSTKNKKDK